MPKTLMRQLKARSFDLLAVVLFAGGIQGAPLDAALLQHVGQILLPDEAIFFFILHDRALQARSQVVRNVIGQRRILLVIDDAWHADAAGLLRCGGPGCAHLLTTRN